MLWYFKFMIAAIVSSLDFINVGPNTTPRLLAAIKFLLEWAATLKGNKTQTNVIKFAPWLIPEKQFLNISQKWKITTKFWNAICRIQIFGMNILSTV